MDADQKVLWFLGIFFQVALILLAQLIAYFLQGENLLLTLLPEDLISSTLTGIGVGLILFLGVFVSYKQLASFQSWSEKVIFPLFKQMNRRLLLTMGILAGLSEELFFRGALQPVIGIILASFLFGFVHYLGKKELLMYGIIAAGMGFVMGLIFIYTGEILVPIVAHSLYNFLVIKGYERGLFS